MSLACLLDHVAKLNKVFSVVWVQQVLSSSHPRFFEIFKEFVKLRIVSELRIYFFGV